MRATIAYISAQRLRQNVERARARCGEGVSLLVCVKANAYGHGMVRCAKALCDMGVRDLGVACTDEALALRESGVRARVLLMGASDPDDYMDLVDADTRIALYDIAQVVPLARAAKAKGKAAHVHIKVNTGMNRLGVDGGAPLARLLATLGENRDWIEVEGVFTHFASAGGDPDFTEQQDARLAAAVELIGHAGFSPLVHAANSEALFLRGWAVRHGMARLGIAAYGYLQDAGRFGLEPVLRWETRVALLRDIEGGQGVSYGLTYRARGARRLALLPVGYGDGYARAIGNRGHVLVRGKRAPVVGRVCMDQCLLDVTDIPGVAVGDQAVLIGSQGDARIGADEIASWLDTIPYEVLCNISARVPRVWA